MSSKRLIPDKQVCERYSISLMTLWRWDNEHPELKFPKPIYLNGRKYRAEQELDAFDAANKAARDTEVA